MDDPCSMVLYEEEVTTAMDYTEEIEGPSTTWSTEKPLGYELTDTKCFKTPSGVQKTATIHQEQLCGNGKEMIGEQIVEMDGEFSMDGIDMHMMPGTSSHPSTSEAPPLSDHQPQPLRRLAIKIGEQVLRFKVIDAADAPEAPVDPTDRWFVDPKPITAPKSLAGLFHCTQCRTYFGNKEVYQRHQLDKHGDPRPFRCFNCGMRFANKTSMTHHLKDHSLLKPMYSCDYCPRVFAKLQSKLNHHKLHFTRSTCQQCMRFFTSEEALRNHQNIAHPPPPPFDHPPPNQLPPDDLLPNGKTARFNCQYCNLRFHFKKDMLVHERVHTGEKPFSCGYCGKGFSQSQALTAHIRVHTKETPFHCRRCKKAFRDNSSLRKHELAHHTDMPIVRQVNVQYTPQIEKQLQIQREQRRKQEMLMSQRQAVYRM